MKAEQDLPPDEEFLACLHKAERYAAAVIRQKPEFYLIEKHNIGMEARSVAYLAIYKAFSSYQAGRMANFQTWVNNCVDQVLRDQYREFKPQWNTFRLNVAQDQAIFRDCLGVDLAGLKDGQRLNLKKPLAPAKADTINDYLYNTYRFIPQWTHHLAATRRDGQVILQGIGKTYHFNEEIDDNMPAAICLDCDSATEADSISKLDQIAVAMHGLSLLEKRIIIRSHGLLGCSESDFETIAQDYGYTAMRIQQLYRAALERMKINMINDRSILMASCRESQEKVVKLQEATEELLLALTQIHRKEKDELERTITHQREIIIELNNTVASIETTNQANLLCCAQTLYELSTEAERDILRQARDIFMHKFRIGA